MCEDEGSSSESKELQKEISERDNSLTIHFIEQIINNLSIFIEILDTDFNLPRFNSTFDGETVPFGLNKLKLIEMIGNLVKFGNEYLIEEIIKLDISSKILVFNF